jgi:hypothetical protein
MLKCPPGIVIPNAVSITSAVLSSVPVLFIQLSVILSFSLLSLFIAMLPLHDRIRILRHHILEL